jgi:hypothetical protein
MYVGVFSSFIFTPAQPIKPGKKIHDHPQQQQQQR